MHPSRRQALRAAGTALTAGLAGCASGAYRSRTTPSDPVEGAWPMAGRGPGHTGRADTTGPVQGNEVRWRFEPESRRHYLEPVVVDGTVYVEARNTLWRLDAASGTLLDDGPWTDAGTPDVGGESATPAVIDGTCYVTGGGKAFAIDVASGRRRGRSPWPTGSSGVSVYQTPIGGTPPGFPGRRRWRRRAARRRPPP